jgi:hypothetical protein
MNLGMECMPRRIDRIQIEFPQDKGRPNQRSLTETAFIHSNDSKGEASCVPLGWHLVTHNGVY